MSSVVHFKQPRRKSSNSIPLELFNDSLHDFLCFYFMNLSYEKPCSTQSIVLRHLFYIALIESK